LQKKIGRRKLIIGLVVAVVVLAAAAVGLLLAWQPVTLEGPAKSAVVQIEAGQGALSIGATLEKQGYVRHAWAFVLRAYLTGRASHLQAGYYQLSTDMATGEILDTLAAGKSAMRRVTFPEGLTRYEMSTILEKEKVCNLPDLLGAASDDEVLKVLGTNTPPRSGTAEGYLFPDTYYFTVDADPTEVVDAMLTQFKDKFFTPDWVPTARAKPWGGLDQVVTLASLVEKEALLDKERPLIAGVLLHRLRINMRLQCDATVQYALGQHKTRLSLDDLKVDSPYNTYKYGGLPPGPICNPGLPSLQAALHPTATDYLFYVAKKDGSHVFTRTYPEHLAAIKALRGAQ
jgi:UPF0755 protein